MENLRLEDVPQVLTKVIENQERIINMLTNNPQDARVQYVPRSEVKKMLNIGSDTTVIEIERWDTLKTASSWAPYPL
jgi:hypothetical protein